MYRNTKAKTRSTKVKANGRVVGEVTAAGVFQKYLYGSRHFLRRPPAIAFDLSSLADAQDHGATQVHIVDLETGENYWAGLDLIARKGFLVERGYGRQLALRLSEWQRTSSPSPQAAPEPKPEPPLQMVLFSEVKE